ncbi:MAG: alpha/beta hydrolase, partial [Prevotella sp.]|nr:alpha/beta hydrolase [Prevotella sp.]
MKRFLIMLLVSAIVSAAMAQESDLFCHKRINLYQLGNMPNAKGTDHRDSIERNRIWRCEQPRMYEYLPGAEERKDAAVILIPGGGYIKQAYETAGVSLAKWLNSIGVTAFVLLHRLPNQPDMTDPVTGPVMDAQRAVKWVRAHAKDYGISPDKIGVMGCSAGAHLSGCVNVAKDDLSKCGDELDTVPCRPNFAILISPAAGAAYEGNFIKGAKDNVKKLLEMYQIDKMVDSTTAPMLMIHASNDRTVSPQNSVEIYKALISNGVK